MLTAKLQLNRQRLWLTSSQAIKNGFLVNRRRNQNNAIYRVEQMDLSDFAKRHQGTGIDDDFHANSSFIISSDQCGSAPTARACRIISFSERPANSAALPNEI